MKLKENGYPEFWGVVKKDFNKKLINPELKCPMNYLCGIKFKQFKPVDSTLPMKYFFIKKRTEKVEIYKNKKIEKLIEKYSMCLYNSDISDEEDFLVLREDFDGMIEDIKKIYVPSKYEQLFSWLLDRTFTITSSAERNIGTTKNKINNNKAILLKTLYTINKNMLLGLFSKRGAEDEDI